MKIKRYKKVHKILKFYTLNFGFRKPYQVIIDGTICVAALNNKIRIRDQFLKYLENDVKLLTTQCIVKEMEKLGSNTFGGLLIIKQFGVHECGHGKSPVPAINCILDMIGENNASRYIIASQDTDLREKCRKIQGVPLLYLHGKTPVLETPSPITETIARIRTTNEFSLNKWENEKLSLLNGENKVVVVGKKRKKKGGPNPLSCKKKKKVDESSNSKSNHNKKKRKRNRNKLVKKIKNEILSSLNL